MTAEERAQLVWKASAAVESLSAVVEAPLHGGGGGGTSGGVTDDWKENVDRQLVQLHADVRNLLYCMIGGIVLLAGAGWIVYDKLSDQVTQIRVEQAKSLGEVQTRSAELAGKLDLLLERTSDGPKEKAAR